MKSVGELLVIYISRFRHDLHVTFVSAIYVQAKKRELFLSILKRSFICCHKNLTRNVDKYERNDMNLLRCFSSIEMELANHVQVIRKYYNIYCKTPKIYLLFHQIVRFKNVENYGANR